MSICQKTWSAALATVILAAAGGAAHAQDIEPPRHRQGYYLGFALLGGTSYIREDGDSLGTYGGSGFGLRLGQLLTRRIGLGLRIDVANGKKGNDQASMFDLSAETQLLLAPNLAAHVGMGLGVIQLKDQADPDAKLRGGVGAAYTLGLSYAWFPWNKGRRSGGFSVTPLLQAHFIPGDGATCFSGLLGVELGWWTGLPRNQLQLPESEAY
jgi:hypothetical protein